MTRRDKIAKLLFDWEANGSTDDPIYIADQIESIYNEWISVESEEKPEDDEVILQGCFSANGGFVWVCHRFNDYRLRLDGQGFVRGTTLWQRITPPKKEEE